MQLLPLDAPLPLLFFRLFLTFLKELLWIFGCSQFSRSPAWVPSLPPCTAALAHVGCSGCECPAKTGQRETTSAFLFSEPGAALDKPILPTLHEAQPALVRELREENPHTNALADPSFHLLGVCSVCSGGCWEQGQEAAMVPGNIRDSALWIVIFG